MMFEMSFNLMDEGKAIRDAVNRSIEAGFVTEDLDRKNSKSTSDVGDWIANNIS